MTPVAVVYAIIGATIGVLQFRGIRGPTWVRFLLAVMMLFIWPFTLTSALLMEIWPAYGRAIRKRFGS